MASPIRLILCDLGNVILPFNLRRAMVGFEAFSRLSSEEIIRTVMKTDLDRDFEKGKLTPESFYREVRARTGLSLPYARFVAVWNDIFTEDAAVSRLIRRLIKHHRVVILSNTNPLHFDHAYKTFPIVREVGEFVLSFREGMRKPDPAFFTTALTRYGASSGETLYIDDREDFVRSANRLGLNGIAFQGADPLLRRIREYGLLPED